ncbi:site-specific DNA-methyltransferase [Pseudothermotoga sp. U03pept]|uniref:site-specific DNA-methyltransferase n=1 Tax=Pseudothermotoga sp. U03pept TaxID=3447012 RepID=UPI003EFC98A6
MEITKFEADFYKALEDLFIGAEIEGKSGYINLMKFKSAYYNNVVKPKLAELITQELKTKCIEDFREELFEKLYTFFKRYFSESGSIYFTYTSWSEKIYERVYDPENDVALFWKTRMLYYVKTEKRYQSMEVKIKGINGTDIVFWFDVSNLEHKKANEKKEMNFTFKGIDEKGRIVLEGYYKEGNKQTNVEDIVRQVRAQSKQIQSHEIAEMLERVTTDDVEKAISIFNKQSEVDYFINKDAEKFLKEQLDMFVYQYMFDSENIWTPKRVMEIQTFKHVAEKIIEFIAQFENELVKIWNKPKFVFNSNYVITIDRLPNEIINKIANHPNLGLQVKEWVELGIVEEGFTFGDVLNTDLFETKNKKYKYLPIDTRYFKDLEPEILSLFDNLDEALDGILIHSENYQALKTILPKFKEKVQTIYIDPPFNKEQDADYLYNVKYKDATWATMLENRLTLAREFLKDSGSIFVRCDYNGNWILRGVMNEIFDDENFRNEIIISRTKAKQQVENRFVQQTESLFFYSKTENLLLKEVERPRNPEWHLLLHFPRENCTPRIVLGKEYYPPKGRRWALSQEKISKFEKEGKVRINENLSYLDCRGVKIEGVPELLYDSETVGNEWIDIPGYGQTQHFPTENSEILLKRVIESTSNEGDLVMDFFLGSGTTIAVAHKLKRKWIGIEMGEHFYTVILPRIKKVLAYDKSGISKEQDVKDKYNEKNAGGFFKYYELEQYEDVLRNTKYEHADIYLRPSAGKDEFSEYIFMRAPKFVEDVVKKENNEFKISFEKLYPDKTIDIAETLSNVLGEKIIKISENYVVLEKTGRIDFDKIPVEYISNLIWW